MIQNSGINRREREDHPIRDRIGPPRHLMSQPRSLPAQNFKILKNHKIDRHHHYSFEFDH